MNVLILEDEPDLILHYSRLCRKLGYGFFVAVNVDEASQILNDEQVDVVISDFHLNGADSSEALVKAQQKNPDVSSIVITGLVSPNVYEKLGPVKNVRVLEKPIGSKTLIDILELKRGEGLAS